MMRLDKYLSERLGIPRGESRKLAAKGRVTVNGVLTKKADTQIEEATAEVAVDGRLLAGAYQKYVYLMLNKPEGVVSAAQDKRDTTVVLPLLHSPTEMCHKASVRSRCIVLYRFAPQ